MSDLKARLEAVLSRRPETPQDAETAARAAEALAAYLRLEAAAEGIGSDREVELGAPEGSELSGLTLHDAAERVLEQAGIPLHARELGRRIKAAGWRHRRSKQARPDQIVYQLAARLPRHPETFVRVAPNTFGLVRWKGKKTNAARPRLGLFSSGGRVSGRAPGDVTSDAVTAHPWRS